MARADLGGFFLAACGSFALHAVLVVGLAVRAALPHPIAEPVDIVDVWAGDATETSVDIEAEAPAATPTPPAPEATPIATPPVEAAAAPEPDGGDARPVAKQVVAAARVPPKTNPKPAAPASGTGKEATSASTSGTFGVDATPSLRNLGYAFTRAISPACQADAGWSREPAGTVASIDVVIEIDADGHLAEPRVTTPSPPKILKELLRRTVALLGRNVFVVRGGDVAAGTQTLRIGATLTDSVDDVRGGDSAVGFSFAKGHGKAPFSQAGGRHVVVSVEILKVTVK